MSEYVVLWSEIARFQLLEKAEYILEQSNELVIADRFIDEIEKLAEKLSYVASAYDDGKFHIFVEDQTKSDSPRLKLPCLSD